VVGSVQPFLSRFQIREGLKMKIMHLPKPVNTALTTWDTVSLRSEELLQWIKSLNPWLHVEKWTVLDSKDESTGRRHILLVDRTQLLPL
jgi:hypothetical protein